MNKISQTCICEVCGNGTMHLQEHYADVEYKGHLGKIKALSFECDSCGADIVTAPVQLENKRAWVRFKKEIDGTPLGKKIAEMRRAHRLTQQEAAYLFGGGIVAFSKYENDDLIPDEPMVNLLKLAIAFPDTIERLQTVKNLRAPICFSHKKKIQIISEREVEARVQQTTATTNKINLVLSYSTEFSAFHSTDQMVTISSPEPSPCVGVTIQ